ncbi:hypothetical protein [Pseudozobellia sp. WGM2]|uniref:hypothetical protein n=1 Tax=Pseudozobellia sp. WGM2 TaxID=2787625 RepID=UPI001AE0C1AC|nr:hypothetical protein [Pseudozobellia sp. WGM2]
MNRYVKILLFLIFAGIVLYIIAIASGYTSFTDCEYYKQNKVSLKFIFLIGLVSFVLGRILKMDNNSIYIFVVAISLFTFFISSHLRQKNISQKLEENTVVITKAVIKKISKHQFTTFLAIITIPKKFKSSLDLQKKSDLGDLKVNDTILIKYSSECYGIWDFHNLSPTKEELKYYSEK